MTPCVHVCQTTTYLMFKIIIIHTGVIVSHYIAYTYHSGTWNPRLLTGRIPRTVRRDLYPVRLKCIPDLSDISRGTRLEDWRLSNARIWAPLSRKRRKKKNHSFTSALDLTLHNIARLSTQGIQLDLERRLLLRRDLPNLITQKCDFHITGEM